MIAMNLPINKLSQTVTVKRTVEGHYDNSGQWVEAGDVAIATIQNTNIHPKSGKEMAATTGTVYESNYTMFAGSDDITFEIGYSSINENDTIIDSKDVPYQVITPGNWGTHYQSDLKKVV